MSTNINRNLTELCQNLCFVYYTQKNTPLHISTIHVVGGNESIHRWVKLFDAVYGA